MITNITSLMSGSKGNSTYIKFGSKHVLIDCGGSYKELNKRLLIEVGVELDDIDYLFITHEHHDHIQCLKTIYDRNDKAVIAMTSKTFYGEKGDNINQEHSKGVKERLKGFNPDMKRIMLYDIDKDNKHIDRPSDVGMGFELFHLQHDVNCMGIILKYRRNGNDISYCHIADNGGRLDWEAIQEGGYLHGHTYYSVESNHDRTMQLLDQKRDTRLKRRCLSNWGHTSNYDCMNNLTRMVNNNTRGVIFTHRSEDCNSLELCKEVHQDYLTVWGERTLFNSIDMVYAEQDRTVSLLEGYNYD